MRRGIKLVYIMAIAGMSSCTDHFRTLADAKAFIEDEDNGMKKEVKIAPYIYRYQYKPAAYILSAETEGSEDKPALEKRKKELDKMWWFNMDISVENYNQSPLRYNLKSLEEYLQRQDYLLNYAVHDFWIMSGTDTLRPVSYWFEHNQNLTSHETVILGFEKPEKAPESIQLVFNDQLFRNGIIKVSFETQKLNKRININP